MLTSRGWSVLVVSFLLLAVAMLDVVVAGLINVNSPRFANTSLEILALAVAGWFWWEWLVFAYRARIVARHLRLEREIWDDRGPVERLWVRRPFEVRLHLVLPGGIRFPYLRVTDLIPYGAEWVDGERSYDGPLEVGESIKMQYRLRSTALGALPFEGVRVQLADPQGFFYFATFIAAPRTYRVLPPLADDRGHSPTLKRFNLLPPPGVHRLRRTGSGSELLDLRDYQPGDPPKTIAWKASARRDRLITKEFESEVPLRCTLFLETSQSVRRGGPGSNALTRLAEIAACVSQANAAARDLTGLCLFDEHGTSYLRPARGPRHLAVLLNRLTDAASLVPILSGLSIDQMLPTAYAFAERVYPDQMRPEVNDSPAWLTWMFPQPSYVFPRPTLGDIGYHWLRYLLIAYIGLSIGVIGLGIAVGVSITRALVRNGQVVAAALVIAALVFALALGLLKLPLAFFPGRRRAQRWRKHLAALFSVRYGLAPGGLSVLCEDDGRFADYLERFLSEHRVPVPLPEDTDGETITVTPDKVRILAEALMRAVSKEHDNELFVLFADLIDLPDAVEPLVRAIKVAVARHHQVLVVLPWPAGVPLPDRDGKETQVDRRDNDERRRRRAAYRQLRRTFAQLGVPVIPAAGDQTTRAILDRLERLRLVGGKR
jgi:uncharacterized protein (DUF58 family)